MRWRIIEVVWKDLVVFVLLQLIIGALSEALDCDHLVWAVQSDCDCSVLYFSLLIYKSGLLYPWTSVSLQPSARSFQLTSLGLPSGSYRLQVQAGTSDGTISLSNVISYTTEGDCDSVAYSVLIFGVLAISLGFSVGLCFGINVLCQLKRKARPDLTRPSKRMCASGRGSLQADQPAQLQFETPCSSYIDASDVHCPSRRESTEARSSASRANSTTDVHATLEQSISSTDYLDILPANIGGHKLDRVYRNTNVTV
eukprot:Em0021g140a